jgi:5-formyltetrahydrofolate cyclo-ligase
MTKQELRSIYLNKRRELSHDEVRDRSERIASIFFHQMDLSGVQFLHIFLPIKKNNEPDTWLIINQLKAEYPRMSIVLPKVNPTSQEIESHLFESEHDLETNAWGIPEPRNSRKVDARLIDMILIPMLCFDLKGNRVGYGKGFYDKFLSGSRGDAERIGISLFEAVDQITDIDSHDQPLHCCVTPNMLMTF